MYIKNGIINSLPILKCEDGRTIINPKHEQWLAEGWQEFVIPQPTAEEIERQNVLNEIEELKAELQASDYKAIKHSEGWITEEDYQPIKAERQAIRSRINELEEKL